MKGKTKNQLIAVIIVAIIAVIATWYITLPRQQYTKLSTLTGISFQPSPPPTTCSPACTAPSVCLGGKCGPPLPNFVFTFSQPIATSSVNGTTAFLKDFKVSPGTDPTTAANATTLINALLKDGGVPFPPVLSGDGLTITSNSMPAALASLPGLSPLSFTGTGDMWFAIPMKKAQ
jgi:hypothetical protein